MKPVKKIKEIKWDSWDGWFVNGWSSFENCPDAIFTLLSLSEGKGEGGGDDNRRVKRSNYFLEENTRERRMRTPSGRIRTSQQKLALEVD